VKKPILFLFSSLLFAGPPMKSSDPFVPELGQFEINIAVEGEYNKNQFFRAPIIDLNYGIIKNVQITLETAYVISQEKSEYIDDFDSFELALKWCFYEGDRFAIAFYPKFKSYPIDSIFNSGETYEIDIPMNFALSDKVDFVFDTAYIMPKDGLDHFEFGTYMKYKNELHTYYAELFLENVGSEEETFTLGGLGYMYQFHKNIAFMISCGRELSSNNKKSTVGYSGLQFVF